MPTIAEGLKSILTEKFHVPEEKIRPDALLTDLGLDSLDVIEVLFEVEDKFGIRVPQEGAALRTATIQELLDTITQLVEEQQAAPSVKEA